MRRFSSIPELEALDAKVTAICSRLDYQIGSIFRIAGQYLKNWGVDITDENRAWIEQRSLQAYYEEWKRTTEATHDAIQAAAEMADFEVGNRQLNAEVGVVAVEILADMMGGEVDREFKICDIGAGTGETTIAVLDELAFLGDLGWQMCEKCKFELIEPSFTALTKAVQKLESHRINKHVEVNFVPIGKATHEFLNEMQLGNFDVIMSSAVFHHMSFPTYLKSIREALAADGVVIVGDWYTTIWKHPAFVAEVLKKLGIGRDELMDFQLLFDVDEGDARAFEKTLTPDQVSTNRKMEDYVLKIRNEFLRIPEDIRARFLEGHEAVEDRTEKMEDSGLTMDLKELKEKHSGFMNMTSNIRRLGPDGAATVMAGGKTPMKIPKKKAAQKKEKGRVAA
jgi:SAM-dependent methyltransferase